jgi:flagellar basal-body rod modification protein FlgD
MTMIAATNAAASAGTSQGASSVTNTLGEDDFLKLLVAQMQNQDPLNPTDPTKYTAQLAQYSQLEQMMNVNTNLGSLISTARNNSQQTEQLSALSLLGKDVVSQGGSFTLGSSPVELGYDLPSTADNVKLDVLDQNQNVVASLPMSETSAGEHYYSWDGTDASGNTVAPGNYTLAVVADAGGTAISGAPLIKGTVQGVDFTTSGSTLATSAGTFDLADVASASNQ